VSLDAERSSTVTQQLEDLEPAAGATPARTSPNLLQIVWQRKALVLLGLVVGLAVGALVYAEKPPIYQSTTQVLVVKKRGEALPLPGGNPGMAFVEDYVASHLVVIKSPIIIEPAVKSPKHNLAALRSFTGMGDEKQITRAIIGSLSVHRDSSQSAATPSNIMNLAYRSSVPEDCGKVLTAIVDSYEDFLDQTYQDVSEKTARLITNAQKLLAGKLAETQKEYDELRLKHPLIIRGKDGVNVHQADVFAYQARYSALKLQQAELQKKIQLLEEAVKDGNGRMAYAAILANSAARVEAATPERSLEQRLVELQIEEQGLVQDGLGQDHPKVQSVRRRIAMLRDFFNRADSAREKTAQGAKPGSEAALSDPVERHLLGLKQQYAEGEATLKVLAGMLTEAQEEAQKLAQYELKEDSLKSEIARHSQFLDATSKQLMTIDLVKEGGGYVARTLSQPTVGTKVAPNMLQILLGGAVLGLLGGIGLAYVAELSDKSFRTPEEIRRRLGLPLVGHIPYYAPNEDVQKRIKAGEKLLDPSLCCQHRPKSVEAEAYRGVRTALYFSTRGEGHKVIQITSPDMGDGKSTLSANLAVSIAQSQKRVVLLDADFRRPRLHKVFGVDTEIGLASVITGQAELEATIRETDVPGLSLLPCGPIPPNPAELLTSPHFETLLQTLSEKYDFVLVDTPPVLAVTDPCVVAPRVDGVLLTIRVSKNSRPHAERATEVLATLGANVLGVVVNGVGGQGKGRYGYGYGNYGYGYGYGYRYGYRYGYGYTYGYNGGNGESYYQDTANGAGSHGGRGAEAGHGENGPSAARGTQQGGPVAGARRGLLGRFFLWWA
jgi:polysaccharide biosynthesis transport protein